MSSDAATSVSQRLFGLAERLTRQADFAEVVASLASGNAATLDGVWGGSCALAASALSLALATTATATAAAGRAEPVGWVERSEPHQNHAQPPLDPIAGSASAGTSGETARLAPPVRLAPLDPPYKSAGPLVVVCPHAAQVDAWLDDLALFTQLPVAAFPAWETLPDENVLHDDVLGDRTRILKRLAGQSTEAGDQPPAAILVTSIQALLQPTPSVAALAGQTRRLRVADELDPQELARWLVAAEFHGASAVELPGEFSLRGGILDLFAHDWFDPVRIEWFGDRIESIRRFEVAGQRSLADLDEVEITVLRRSERHTAHFADHLPRGAWFLLVEPEDLRHAGQSFYERIERADRLHTLDAALAQVLRFPSVTASAVAASSAETTCRLRFETVERFSGDIGKVREELDAVGLAQEVFVVCQTDAEAERLSELFRGTRLAQRGGLFFPRGNLSQGFRSIDEGIVLVGSGELFHRTDLRRSVSKRLGKAIDSFVELREGDYVVHVSHGIGRYRGMTLLTKGDQVEEHLALEFAEGAKLYVPSSKIGLVQKYVGGKKARPRMARLGGRKWGRQKEAVETAVTDLAAEMLEMQAARNARPGIAFPGDTEWQREFDASFPYQETPDQLQAIGAIRHDMLLSRPMDRLLCGDVGFGKTELAMRAAFKAIDAGYQVAVLVPTTILAEQHVRTFRSRMAEFPFHIASLSRFATRKQQNEILARLELGEIDVVVGTHRLAQDDVKFHNLGLLIIDEEQRFGVEVKERLKAVRRTVDVLTMTATPIPRTLHMALLGLRDISNLETPPQDRLAVETRVSRFDPALIRHAILRELSREGQAFFVHNRIADIEILATRLRQIVPEASIAVGHAQMPEHQLEQIMLDFVDRRFDVLLSTTIVESGLDIPNANTIFIDEADRYGLADLHQLRGRVGRYKHRAYCHLLVDPNKHIAPNAARRLRAIEEFSDLGAGFALAMRDLEIRGAGNILGTEQSGHIATVGYELYCELLEQAVCRLRQLPPRSVLEVDVDLPMEAYLPRAYVPGMREKIDLYRRLARATTPEELTGFTAELIDRFGPLPPPARRLLSLAELRIAAGRWLVQSVRLENQYAVLTYLSQPLIRQLATRSGGRLRVVDDRSAYLPLSQDLRGPEEIVAHLKLLLQSA